MEGNEAMNNPFVLIDTDILIDASRGMARAIRTLEELDETHRISVSVVTELELMVGCENKMEFRKLNKFLERFEIFHLTERISLEAVELFKLYRLSLGVLIADMFIASTALIYDDELISKNQKDFRFVDDLKLLNYT